MEVLTVKFQLQLRSGSGFCQNFGIGSGLGSGLKMSSGFLGILDLEQQEFSHFGGENHICVFSGQLCVFKY
jgi:hypothetical protein